uniref:Uncharacterized protein n=1 Tax=Lysobacter enzymogenes TaxID=69 RepID=A1EBU3_LYSEN|nr:unknown [Lysobacter enzymogenes]
MPAGTVWARTSASPRNCWRPGARAPSAAACSAPGSRPRPRRHCWRRNRARASPPPRCAGRARGWNGWCATWARWPTPRRSAPKCGASRCVGSSRRWTTPTCSRSTARSGTARCKTSWPCNWASTSTARCARPTMRRCTPCSTCAAAPNCGCGPSAATPAWPTGPACCCRATCTTKRRRWSRTCRRTWSSGCIPITARAR